MTIVYNAVGQTDGHGVWLYAFTTFDEALQFVEAVEAMAIEFPDHSAYDIAWDVIPTLVTTIDDAVAQMRTLSKELP